jgi:preprotein translocase subunit YajC
VSIIAGIPLYIPLIVGGVIFWMVLTLAERKTDKTYNYTKFIENLEKGDLPDHKSGLAKYFNPFLASTQKRIKLSKDVEEELEKKFKEAAWNITPQQFYTTKVLYPVVLVSIFLLLGFIRDNNIIFYILAAVSSLTYYYPNYILKQKLKNAAAMRRFELPNFLTPLGLMMYSYTPFQAVKKSLKFAGPYLRPYVEKLVIEMEMYPSSTKPFRKFADDLGIPEAQTFMTALQQAINTDPSKSRNIIQNQIEMMRKLREENYMMIIELRPLAMNKYNFLLIVCILVIPVVALVNVLMSVAQ